MGIWDKFREKEEEKETVTYEEPAREEQVKPAVQQSGGYAPRAASPSALELKVVRPESYASAGKIADHLLSRRTVVLNLEATNKETAKRLIDFLSGVAYSIGGNIRRVAANTFVITPSNVGISGEDSGENAEEEPAAKPETSGEDFAF
ncbi:MAG: cell division protein SepF [Clostridia bacterium]|nr:cell division protein SepF [Clostridia bacterium]